LTSAAPRAGDESGSRGDGAPPVRRLALLFGLGLLVRLALLPTPGTFDTNEWKAWSACAVQQGLAGVYGPPDRKILRMAERAGGGDTLRGLVALRFPRFGCEWQGRRTFVDYPPASLLLLFGLGKVYAVLEPSLDDSLVFNAVINVAPLLGSLGLVWLLLTSAPAPIGRERAAALWFNPALLLAAPVLGYQDPVFGAAGLATILALQARRYVLAAAWLALAGLLKPQGVLLVPVFLAVVGREASVRVWWRCGLVGLGLGLLVTAPWWSTGYGLACLGGMLRPLSDTDLAPLGLNLWWVAGYILQWLEAGPWPLASIVKIEAFRQQVGFDPGLIAAPLLIAGSLAAALHVLRCGPEDREAIPRALILQVHVYAFAALRVHENHALLALFVAPLLMGGRSTAGRRIVAALSLLAFVNLLLAVRNGEGIMTRDWVLALSVLPMVDALFVLAALGHGILLAILFRTFVAPR